MDMVIDPLLLVHASSVDFVEDSRIAAENRLTRLTGTEPDPDGVMRGFGLSLDHPDVARLVVHLEDLKVLEHQTVLDLKRSFRSCAIYPWVKGQMGLGEKQAARLLASVKDPYLNLSTGEPRTVSQLWSYCGLSVEGSKAVSRKKGVSSSWSSAAKSRAYLCASSCIKKSSSPYRMVYDARREHTAEAHPDWTPGHSHADGLRLASKEILKRLWVESRRLHEEGMA